MTAFNFTNPSIEIFVFQQATEKKISTIDYSKLLGERNRLVSLFITNEFEKKREVSFKTKIQCFSEL